MDQRVDNERRGESAPNREAKSSGGGAAKKPARLDGLGKRRGLAIALVIGAIVLAVLVIVWWLHARQYESTDDAFIDTRTVQISAQVSAAIVDVPVTDNQLVEAGTVLVRLDDRDFTTQLAQARAQVAQAEAGIANLKAQLVAQDARIEEANKQVAQAEATLTFAQQQADRYVLLAKQGATTQEQAQQYSSNLLQSQASLAAAQANAVAAAKQKPVLGAQEELSEADLMQRNPAVQQAETNLSRTIITAPVAGRVTQLTAAKGNYAAVGQTLMMFVPRDVWVTANFKETQLAKIRPGQPVDIEIDSFPDRTFAGHIDSIQSGSGTAFSLLPAENATGNYVKIVQRVPVKIVFDKPPDVQLGPGMSVVPTVKVR
ncbi:MAG: HlyD family secretion protein [Xanthobacteraceae bacterium]|jgi:membrane fusion protein (multidrug efflux system)